MGSMTLLLGETLLFSVYQRKNKKRKKVIKEKNNFFALMDKGVNCQ